MTVAMTFVSLSSKAQEAFKGVYRCDTLAATLTIDLTAPTISLPDLDFDETYGYMKGQLNGTWVILKVKKTDKKKALVRMISDIGIDAQDVELSLTDEGNLQLRLVGEQNMKAISQRNREPGQWNSLLPHISTVSILLSVKLSNTAMALLSS